jgi:hypothetical protein
MRLNLYIAPLAALVSVVLAFPVQNGKSSLRRSTAMKNSHAHHIIDVAVRHADGVVGSSWNERKIANRVSRAEAIEFDADEAVRNSWFERNIANKVVVDAKD